MTKRLLTLQALPRLLLASLLVTSLTACATTTPTQVLTLPTASSEKYAAIVVDAGTGKTLFSSASDERRYPASLTKMMTLYLLFEALDSGRVTKATQMPVSAYAASRPPSKLGLKTVQTIDVSTAIDALVVRSANDVAAVVGEYLAGSEPQFASNMTARARQIGMTRTTFRNASGLPDPGQTTCARDMALLGLALKRRFPHHYHVFDKQEFFYAGKRIRGHNKLLATGGVDGIKTGYIRASGFNVVTSVDRDGKQLVAVVMGGESAAKRDAHMRDLISRYLPAATRRGGASGLPGL